MGVEVFAHYHWVCWRLRYHEKQDSSFSVPLSSPSAQPAQGSSLPLPILNREACKRHTRFTDTCTDLGSAKCQKTSMKLRREDKVRPHVRNLLTGWVFIHGFHFSKIILSQKLLSRNSLSSRGKVIWWFVLLKQKSEKNFFPSLTAFPRPICWQSW